MLKSSICLFSLYIDYMHPTMFCGCETCPLEAQFQSKEQPKGIESEIWEVWRLGDDRNCCTTRDGQLPQNKLCTDKSYLQIIGQNHMNRPVGFLFAIILSHFKYNTAEVTIHSSTKCGPTSPCITVLIRVPALTERVLALTVRVFTLTHSLRVPALTERPVCVCPLDLRTR
jgi:hypothetical protein